MTDTITQPAPEFAPEPPPHGPIVWARENLFSSVFNSILSIAFGLVGIFGIQALLAFVFREGRRWDAVTINLRLLMVQAYPQEQFHRVWISVGIVVVLGGLSAAIWRSGGLMSIARLSKILMAIGAVFGLIAVLGPFSAAARVTNLIIGAVLFLAGYLPRQLFADRIKEDIIPTLLLAVVAAGLAIVGLYFLEVPVPIQGGGQELQGIASSTTGPITILYFVLIASYLVGLGIRDRVPGRLARGLLVGVWVASFPIISMIILRDPELLPFSFFRKWDIINSAPSADALVDGSALTGFLTLAGLVVIMGVLVYAVSVAHLPELGRAAIILGILAVVLGSWGTSALISFRILMLLGLLFVLGAQTFGGEASTRVRYMIVYFASMTVVIYFLIVAESGSTVEVPGRSFLGGLLLTFILAIAGIALSFPIGLLLALGRTSSMPIFRLLSVGYIEFVRGVPLITWLIVGSVLLPLFLPLGLDIDSAVRAILAVAFFSAAYLAENVRGGLQSIPTGQYEAARALGMTTVQMTIFITLPQALRAVIPALVGQTIAIFKDTSLVTIVSLFDFLHLARSVIPTQTTPFNFLGSIKETLLFAALVYWIFTFAFSRASLRLEKKLGVGER